MGKILVNSVDADLEKMRTGFAWHYKAYAREQSAMDRDAYARAADEVACRRSRIVTRRNADTP